MFQGMTLGEQRTLLAVALVVAVGLGYRAYRQGQTRDAVYVERGPESAAAAAAAKPAPPAVPPVQPASAAPAPAGPAALSPPPASRPSASSPANGAAAPASNRPPPYNAGQVDLNSATQEQLESLPQIGPVKAQAILEYRRRVGKLYSVAELRNVSGIGEKTLESLRPHVYVGP